MTVTIARLVALLLAALASGIAFSHVLEVPGKRRLPTDVAVTVQQGLYVGYRLPGALIEVGAIAACAVAVVVGWNRPGCYLTLAALVAMLGAQVVFALVTDPQNRRILSWRVSDLPDDWTRVRARWEASHGLRAFLFLSAVGLIALALHKA
jgi:uncharacterized membrane protein